MAVFKKRYVHKISRNGEYLGVLPYVSSEFELHQNLYTVGAQLTIEVGQSADTANLPVEDLLDEPGNALLAEDGSHITTERVADIVGDANSNALIRNDNTIEVIEYSAEHPNGVTVFSGYISKWKTIFGGPDHVEITCLSLGQDLANYINAGGTADTLDQSQTQDDGGVGGDVSTWSAQRFGQTFKVGAGITNISKITLKLSTDPVGTSQTTVVKLWNSVSDANVGTSPIGTATTTHVGYDQQVDFVFSTPISVTAGGTYFFTIVPDSRPDTSQPGYFLTFANKSSSVYADGQRYRNLSGGGYTVPFDYDMWFKTYYSANSTAKTFTSTDPSTMLTSLMNSYIAAGGDVSIGSGFSATGVSATYTFNLNTLAEVIQKVYELGPASWYWYVDPASNTLYYKATGTTADHTMVKGKHITELSIEATKEDIANVVYFTGGESAVAGQNVYVNVNDTTSLVNNRRGLARISDPKVKGATGAATGTIIANNYINGHNAQTYITEITISAQTYDITLFDLGELIGFGGFGTFVDNLLLQIVGITRRPDSVTLSLGALRQRATAQMEDLQKSLNATQTTNNPAQPS